MSLTYRVLALVLLALAPALAIQGYNEYALRAARDEAVRADTLTTARGVAEDLAQVADGVRQSLNLVAQDPSVRALDPPACTDYLRRAAAELPHLALLALTRPDGVVVCNSIGSPPGSYTNADRVYHREALAADGFAMGRYARGVATGKDSVHFAEPLRGRGGETAGVLVAALDLDWLSLRLQQGLRLPSTSVTVLDDAQTVLVRRPDGADWIGRPLPEDRRDLLASRGEGVRVAPGFDGRERVIAAVQPKGPAGRAWVVVGRDRAVAFADVDAATQRGLWMITSGAAASLAAALLAGRLFIRRPFERLLRAAAAWQAGDLAARTGLAGRDEFGRLGSKLDAMAGTLRSNEADLRAEILHSRGMQERQVTMLHELNHRVKNTLATVQSLARQAQGGAAQGAQLEARILALSKTHDLLTREDWTGASLREVLENELAPYRGSGEHITIEGPEVALPPRYVLAIGMTVHELTTNAAKYGALSTAEGRVGVVWSLILGEGGGRHLRLDWRESCGPEVREPRRRGFGTRLIAGGIQRELGGEVRMSFDPDGLHCLLALPLANSEPGMMSPTATERPH